MDLCYQVLDLEIGASDSEIKKQYRKLVRVHHPDKNNGVESETFHKIQNAYNVLIKGDLSSLPPTTETHDQSQSPSPSPSPYFYPKDPTTDLFDNLFFNNSPPVPPTPSVPQVPPVLKSPPKTINVKISNRKMKKITYFRKNVDGSKTSIVFKLDPKESSEFIFRSEGDHLYGYDARGDLRINLIYRSLDEFSQSV